MALGCSFIPLPWQNPAKLQIGSCSCICTHAGWNKCQNVIESKWFEWKGTFKGHLVQAPLMSHAVSAHWSWIQAFLVLSSTFPWSKHEDFKSTCDFRLSVKWGCSFTLQDAISRHSPPWGKRDFCPRWGLKPFGFEADRSSWAWKHLVSFLLPSCLIISIDYFRNWAGIFRSCFQKPQCHNFYSRYRCRGISWATFLLYWEGVRDHCRACGVIPGWTRGSSSCEGFWAARECLGCSVLNKTRVQRCHCWYFSCVGCQQRWGVWGFIADT